jgi:hypothetical protein
VSYDAGGTAYLSTLLNDRTFAKASAVEVSSSTTGGASWAPAQVVQADAGGPWNDAPSVTGDATLSNTAYVTWQRTAVNPDTGVVERPAMLSGTSDGGRHWSTPRAVITPAAGRLLVGDQIVSLPTGFGPDSGTLLLFHGEMPLTQDSEDIYVSRSIDHGASWSPPQPVVTGLPGVTRAFTAAAGSGHRVHLMLLTPDGALKLATSSTAGRTWGTPATVVDGANAPTDWNFAATRDGTLGLLFSDKRNNTAGATDTPVADVWLRTSADDGASWQERHLAGPFQRAADGLFAGLAALPDTSLGAAYVLGPPYADPTDVFFSRQP